MVLSLVQVVAEKTEALRQLEDAFHAQLGIGGGRTAVLDGVVQIARANGFCGSLELAAGILRANHRFVVEKGPAGRWVAARRSTALVPIATGRKSTALVPVAVNRQLGPASFLGEIPQG